MILMKSFDSLRETTLLTAWAWGALAMAAWSFTWVADRNIRSLSSPLADHAWYACAILSLCPPIAVLGSRRPGSRVWAWFILCPMILVLGWPVGSLWLQGTELRGLQLENPQLAAFCLVLVMGIGNFCGTRFTLPALLYGMSILGIVVSMSAIAPAGLIDRSSIRFWCSCLMVLALGLCATSTRPPASNELDQLWFDFFDTFGIVWGRRIQDRVNFQIHKEQLPVHLELDGFRWEDSSQIQLDLQIPTSGQSILSPLPSSRQRPKGALTEARIEQILRWLLRRFVNPSWIDRRLKSNTNNSVAELSIDS